MRALHGHSALGRFGSSGLRFGVLRKLLGLGFIYGLGGLYAYAKHCVGLGILGKFWVFSTEVSDCPKNKIVRKVLGVGLIGVHRVYMHAYRVYVGH